jgi:hypothetical protein
MMIFSIYFLEFGKVFLIIQNSGAFDQDVLASGSRSNRNLYALVGFRLNLLAYLSGAKKRKSLRMGSSSDAEPMREGGNGLSIIGGPSLEPVTELSTELFRFLNSISSWGFQFEGSKVGCGLVSLDLFKGG